MGKELRRAVCRDSTRGLKTVQLAVVDLSTGKSHTIVRDTRRRSWISTATDWAVANGGEDISGSPSATAGAISYRYAETARSRTRSSEDRTRSAASVRVDSARKQIYFTAWGKEAGSPHYAYLYRVGFDGSGMTLLTPEPGNHTIRLVPRAPYFIDTYSQIATPPVTVLRDADGKVVMELARGDDTPLRAIGWTPAEVFTVKARDGKTDLWGILHKPSTFDPTRQYPIVTLHLSRAAARQRRRLGVQGTGLGARHLGRDAEDKYVRRATWARRACGARSRSSASSSSSSTR